MRSAARAIGWGFCQGHRWGLLALAGYVLVVAGFDLLRLEPGQIVELDPPDGSAGLVIAPFSMIFMYFIAVFTFGLSSDLAARRSTYPTRMFALPVTTAALVGWPMLYGMVAMMSLWLTMALCVRGLLGINLPLLWPALATAAFLAWMQALMWMPYGLPGLRVIVSVLWLITLDAVVILSIHFEVAESLLVAFLAPQLPLAYLAARFAVAQARHGAVPDWRGRFGRRSGAAGLADRRLPFPSPARAQAWFEWRQHGGSLPGWVAILLPFELALLFVAGTDRPAFVFYVLILVLLTPPVIAAFVAVTVSKADPQGRDPYGLAPFSATRPLSSAALVAAKLRMTLMTTLAAWLLVFIAVPLALTLAGLWPMVIDGASRKLGSLGAPRAIVLVLLLISVLMASTWKQLVQGLYIGLTGRAWLIQANAFLLLSFLVFIGPIAQWLIDDSSARIALWNALPWILTALMGVKLSAAAWVATRLYHRRLLSDRALVIGAAIWLVTVLALFMLLVWWFDTAWIANYILLQVAVLTIPLARLSAAPLALAWNRHR